MAQVLAHTHGRYEVDISLSTDCTLHGFVVHPGVMRPDVMASSILARYLFSIRDRLSAKRCLDMGCGTGIQGAAMALAGASELLASDIALQAVANARENFARLSLSSRTAAVQGDLFEHAQGPFDVIAFNHPFFVGALSPSLRRKLLGPRLSRGAFVHDFISDAGLIHRFLDLARAALAPGGFIVMPMFHLAGETANPAAQAPAHGFAVREVLRISAETGIQQGPISVYELSPSAAE